jgi:hypothetical protein
MDRSDSLPLIGTASIALFVVSLVAVFYAVRFRSWWLAAVAALFSLPLCLITPIALALHCLIPFLQLAVAIALRWRVGAAGTLALLATGVIIALVGGPGTILVHGRYARVLFIGLLVGFMALAWSRPPWVPVEQPRPER